MHRRKAVIGDAGFTMPDIHFHALLPARAKSGEDPLVGFLKGARGTPVSLSARDVHRIDSHRLQLMLVAQRQWAMEAQPFSVTDMSEAFREGLTRLGLPDNYFDQEAVQ